MFGDRPAPGAWLRASLVLTALPAATLLAGMAAGAIAPRPGVAVLAVTMLSGVAVARLWLGHLASLSRQIRAAASGGAVPHLDGQPLLPAVREVADGVARLARSLEDRGALVERLRRADAAISEALPDPLLVLAADAAPLRANRAARRLFGLAGASLAGGGLGALLRHPALAGEGPQQAELALPAMRECTARLLPLDPPLPDGGRLLLVLADRSAARAAERMRVDFVTNASHELRTPLASIMGFIETLRGPAADDPKAQQRFLAIMAEQGERMRRLIEDLLGLSRVEATEHLPPTAPWVARARSRPSWRCPPCANAWPGWSRWTRPCPMAAGCCWCWPTARPCARQSGGGRSS